MKRIIISTLAVLAGMALSAQNWAPVGENIKTRWASEVNPSSPLPEYPRPQMVRGEWMNLNGLWNYMQLHLMQKVRFWFLIPLNQLFQE